MKIGKEYKPSGRAGGVPIGPTWPYYKQMLYLVPFMKHRLTKRQLQDYREGPITNYIK